MYLSLRHRKACYHLTGVHFVTPRKVVKKLESKKMINFSDPNDSDPNDSGYNLCRITI